MPTYLHFNFFFIGINLILFVSCEAWLVEDRLTSFVNYVSFFVCRPQLNGGGLAILSRNDSCVACKNISALPDGHLEYQAVSV